MNWLHDLLGEMAAHGFAPADGVNADGELHRFHVEADKRGTRNGWYVIHADDYPTAVFGSWRTGEQCRWKAGGHDSPGEHHQRREAIQREQARRRAEAERDHADAAARARQIWDAALDPGPAHRYLRGKAIRPHGIRQYRDALVVPLRDITGRIHSLQFVAPGGEKRFLRGGRTKGLLHVIGKRTPRVWLSEGLATAASLHADLGEQVVIAFTCSNLMSVADAVLKHWRPPTLAIMADDDWRTPANPGIEAARQVGERFGLEWFRPEFPPNRPDWATDYNDAFRLWATARKGAA